MRNIFIILILLLNISPVTFSQEVSDSNRFDRLIKETEEDLNALDNKYGRIKIDMEKYQAGNDLVHKSLEFSDSIHSGAINELRVENMELRKEILENRDSVDLKIATLQYEIYNLKKGNATILIIIFSLLVIFFVYFFYRNYRIEAYVNQQYIKLSLESEKKYGKLKDNFRKKISKLSESLEKKFKKRISKTEKSLRKQIRKKK